MRTVLLISISTIYHDGRIKTYIQKLNSLGYKVLVISLKESSKEKIIEKKSFINYKIVKRYIGNSKIGYIYFYMSFFLISFFLIPYLTIKYKIDLIHYNNSPNFIIFSATVSRIFRTKIILDNHDIVPLMVQSKFKSRLLLKLAEIEQTLSMSFANKILCADHNQMEYLISKNITPNKISVILNVPNELILNYSLKENITNGYFNLVYHGTISYRLGIDLIIEAINLLKGKIENLKFHLIGKGDYLTFINKLVSEYNIQNNVIIYNKYVPYEELPEILTQMDVGVIANRPELLSDYMLPVKLLEYVSLKIPVIVPRNKIISRYFNDEMLCYYKPGEIEELAQRIAFLYFNEGARKKYSNCAFKFTELHNYNTEMNKYSEILEQLLS